MIKIGPTKSKPQRTVGLGLTALAGVGYLGIHSYCKLNW